MDGRAVRRRATVPAQEAIDVGFGSRDSGRDKRGPKSRKGDGARIDNNPSTYTIAFFTFAALLLLGFAIFTLAGALSKHAEPELDMYYNANVYSSDPEHINTVFTAFIVDRKTGKFLYVGSETQMVHQYSKVLYFEDVRAIDIRSRKPKNYTPINLLGSTVVPGFVDAHGHITELGIASSQANIEGSKSIDEVVARLQPFYEAARLKQSRVGAGKPVWLRARGWDQNLFIDKQFPTKDALDRAFPDIPVVLERVDSHACLINSAALRIVGELPPKDPEGGRVLRDADNKPTGVFIDTAMQYVFDRIPTLTDEEVMEGLQKGIQICNSKGLTSVHYAAVDSQTAKVMMNAVDQGKMSLRVHTLLKGMSEPAAKWCIKKELDYKDKHLLSIRGVKFFQDGALGSRGAALLEPYSDSSKDSGLLMMTDEQFKQNITQWIKCGFQVATHAIGDKANKMVLDGYHSVVRSTMSASEAAKLRLRIEHAQIVTLDDFEKFKTFGIVASVQPRHATSDMLYAEDRLGSKRLKGAYAWRTFKNAGVHLALGSDFPIEPADPILGFYSAVTRQSLDGEPQGGWYPSEKLTRSEALSGFTLDAAYAGFQDHWVGSIKAGKLADFVVLDRDIMTIPDNEIPATKVLATYLSGKAVFDAASSERDNILKQ